MTEIRILEFPSSCEPVRDDLHIGIPEGMTDIEAVEKSNAIHAAVVSRGEWQSSDFEKALTEAGFISIRRVEGASWDDPYVDYEAPVKTLINQSKRRRN